MKVDRVPSRTGLVLTGLASVVAAGSATLGGGVPALFGIPLAVLGVRRVSRWILAGGVALLLTGVLVTGLQAGSPPVVLGAMVGTVLTWDLGENAISLAEQLRGGSSDRPEIVHAATSTFVASTFAIGSYVVFLLASGGQPGVAVSLLVFGTVLVLLVLGR